MTSSSTSDQPSSTSSTDQPGTQTLAYYDENARTFSDSTVNVEFSSMHERFEALPSPGARILDFGCGSGRDAKHFADAGYQVTATDGSAKLCRLARTHTGLPVRHELFQDLADVEAYDAIWACSSILHLPKRELPDVLAKMARAVMPGAVIYTSFKLGSFEGMRNGRYFTDLTEPAFRELLGQVESLSVEQCWTTSDVRPGRDAEQWLNLVLRKA